MAILEQTLRTFWHLLIEAVPLFLLGAVLGAALEAWLKPEWVGRWIGGGHRSVATAALAGALLPGCAMSTMPLAHSLKQRGAAVGTLTAFIMIAPILSPHTILLTATLVNVPMAIGRVVLSFAVSLLLGGFLNAMHARSRVASANINGNNATPDIIGVSTEGGGGVLGAASERDQCCAGERAPVNSSSRQRFFAQLVASLRTLTPFLLGGLLAAALVSALVPAEIVRQYLRGGWTAYFFAAVIAFPIYVCDGGEIPLTRALLQMGVGPGPAFCFMLASVGTCLPTIAMATRIVGWNATCSYIAAWLILAVGGGVVMAILL
ncbi:MAG TPA: permease [Chthoniobacterales bacterium]|nr:permease [Chthoniobacterales bacterium]